LRVLWADATAIDGAAIDALVTDAASRAP